RRGAGAARPPYCRWRSSSGLRGLVRRTRSSHIVGGESGCELWVQKQLSHLHSTGSFRTAVSGAGRNAEIEEQGATQRDCAKERSVVLLHVGASPVRRRGGSRSPGHAPPGWDASPRLGGNKGLGKTRFRGWRALVSVAEFWHGELGQHCCPKVRPAPAASHSRRARGNARGADCTEGAERAATQETPERRGTAARHVTGSASYRGAGRRSGRGGCVSGMSAASARRGRR